MISDNVIKYMPTVKFYILFILVNASVCQETIVFLGTCKTREWKTRHENACVL